MPSIFLSHSSRDKFFVHELAKKLREHGVTTWIDEAEINVGDSLTDKIGKAIEDTDYMGIILSHNSVQSTWVQKELQIALQKELRGSKVVVLPILIEDVLIPPFLEDKLYADFTSPEKINKNFPRLLKALGVSGKKAIKIENSVEKTQVKRDVSEDKFTSPAERRLEKFTDIKIIELDEKETYKPDPSYVLYNMYLRLSEEPPAEWQQIFEAERKFPRHTMWRRAWIEGDYIVIYCVPEELEKYHLRDLKQDVNNANKKYRDFLIKVAREQMREQHKKQMERDEINNIKKRLDFD